jgi:hypothetical protein
VEISLGKCARAACFLFFILFFRSFKKGCDMMNKNAFVVGVIESSDSDFIGK